MSSGRAAACRATAAAALVGLVALSFACRFGKESGEQEPEAAAPKRLPAPIFDGLALGMSRAEVARHHRIRMTRTASGRKARVWVYNRSGKFTVTLRFDGAASTARLSRFDVRFGPRTESADQFIDDFEQTLGTPDVRRRKAMIASYGDRRHEQYDTIWSDVAQYVYLTERVAAGERAGATVFYLTVKEKEIAAPGPPTGYVPPPPPPDEDGAPTEQEPF